MIWLQHWADVLFLHFPLDERQLRRFVSKELTIDTYDGNAWLSYVFFRLKLRPKWLPILPGFSHLNELNVRTYVRYRDQPGICFLRMYADNHLAIAASRLLTSLKYELASLIFQPHGNGSRLITCQPQGSQGSIQVEFRVAAAGSNPVAANGLDAWLIERYRAFVPRSNQPLLMATVEHPPWETSPADLICYNDGLLSDLGISPAGPPALMHFSPGLAARFNAFQISTGPEIADPSVCDKDRRSKEKVAGTGFEPATSRL